MMTTMSRASSATSSRMSEPTQPASPETSLSRTSPRFVSSVAMPVKSAGVGAGGVTVTEPQPASSRTARSARTDARRGATIRG